jgi:hypothetical protein
VRDIAKQRLRPAVKVCRGVEVYRKEATAIAAGLEHDEERDAARLAPRGFLEKIVIPPGEALLQVLGKVGVMLAAAQARTVYQPDMVELGGISGCGGGI